MEGGDGSQERLKRNFAPKGVVDTISGHQRDVVCPKAFDFIDDTHECAIEEIIDF